jgi:cyclopropane fatty-acyl-phospholipid synthase-like methyltransferase
MPQRFEVYDRTYGRFSGAVQAAIRRETFGEDIGQNSWLTVDEYHTFLAWLELHADHHALDVACGAGGPTLFLARTVGCRVTGIDISENGIATATQMAVDAGLHSRVHFQVADVQEPLPFSPGTFHAIVCIDAIHHFSDRLQVLKDWFRVLQPGARLLYTDGAVVTGPISSEEIAMKSVLGLTVFVPPGANETLLEHAGFRVVRCEDVTENAAWVSERWHASRQRHCDQLVQLIGQERFDSMQSYFALIHRLSSEQRVSRMVYVAEKPTA